VCVCVYVCSSSSSVLAMHTRMEWAAVIRRTGMHVPTTCAYMDERADASKGIRAGVDSIGDIGLTESSVRAAEGYCVKCMCSNIRIV